MRKHVKGASRRKSSHAAGKVRIKMAVDCLMTITLLLLMPYSLLGETAHEWLGIGMLLLVILHHLLNLSWIRALGKGRFGTYRVAQTGVAALLFLTMTGSMISGIMISNHIFDFLPVRSGTETARLTHMFCGYWGFVLMSIHLGMHWKMLMGIFRNRFKIQPSKVRATVLKGTALLMAVYGAYAFYDADIVSYLFLKTHFVFIDFKKSLAVFLLEHLAMMGFFIFVSYYAAGLLQRTAGRQRKL